MGAQPESRPPGNSDEDPNAWLVRHGETEWASLGRHTGRTDVPLTEAGKRQALAVRSKLEGHSFALVLSSPRSRALDTARLAGFGDVVEVDPDLAEWDYGAWEGMTTPEIRERIPGWTLWANGARDGETPEQVAARCDRVIARVREAQGDTLLFGHGHLLRVLTARWLDLGPSEGRHFALATATVSVLGWERETPVVERWNEACG
jgi:broad specificity phosphatase PhoE